MILKNIHILFVTGAIVFSYIGHNNPITTILKVTIENNKKFQKESVYDSLENKGIGPIKEVILEAKINQDLAGAGKTLFNVKCTACHKVEKKFIGPALKGILEKRSAEWVMNMMLNPEEMIQEDSTAKTLFEAYNGIPMPNQELTPKEARSILEYFRIL